MKELTEKEWESLYKTARGYLADIDSGNGDYDAGDGSLLFVRSCKMCGKTHRFAVRTSDYEDWCDGALVQNAFPYLADWKRELLQSGICDECWKKIFAN